MMVDGQTRVNPSEGGWDPIPLRDDTIATTTMSSLFHGRDSPLLQASASFKGDTWAAKKMTGAFAPLWHRFILHFYFYSRPVE